MLYFKPPWRLSVRYFQSTSPNLAGHNKWSKIKEGKGVNDQLKSKIYGRSNREIVLAARKGGSTDPTLNGALANAISKARSNGVPKANIQSALDQAQKNKGVDLDYNYEALFAGKVGLIIECFSDNNTRTLHEVRHIVKEHGAHLTPVTYMFQKVGRIRVSLCPDQTFQDLWDEAVEGGAQEVEEAGVEHAATEGRTVDITVSPERCVELEQRLGTLSYRVMESEIVLVPLDVGVILDEETRKATRNLIRELEEHPDVHHVQVSPRI